MLDLVDHLQAQGLEIRYDQVVLQIGDSLIQKISREIGEGDFLIAIVSPDSVESGRCQRELSLAATQGINQNRVKALPVKFRGAEMPPMLGDIYGAEQQWQEAAVLQAQYLRPQINGDTFHSTTSPTK